jgi:hypothetical protein
MPADALSLDGFQAMLDAVADNALDVCEQCGAPRRKTVPAGFDARGRPRYAVLGGCEHQ